MPTLLAANRSAARAHDQQLVATMLLAAVLVALLGCAGTAPEYSKTARSPNGMVAASTPYATAAGVSMLEKSGNAVDAAVAALFALTVTDPPMTSLGGRCQMIIALADGRIVGIGGATQAPSRLDPPGEQDKPRGRYQVVPVPGVPAAAAEAVIQYGRLSLAEVLEPAIRLAEDGFAVTPRIGEIWEQQWPRLALDEGARENYLRPGGAPYRAGQIYRNRRLAALLRRIADGGPDIFYRGPVAEVIAADVRSQGGFLERRDLENYRVEPGRIVRAGYRGLQIVTLGKRTWGHTLIEMLNMLGHFKLSSGPPEPREVELLARIIGQAVEDRPQRLGTLEPKPAGLPLSLLASTAFAQERAGMIRAQLGRPLPAQPAVAGGGDVETTHLSVMDAEGNAVSLTTSIGPRFGTRVATPVLGFLYAYSYNMRSLGLAGLRARTEMTPTVVLQDGRPVLAVGAAGSERIPAAILQVISNIVDREYTLRDAVAAPRIFAVGNTVRLHNEFPEAVTTHLENLGYELDLRGRNITRHLGIVHAVQYDPKDGHYSGAADPVYDGAAAGPQ